MIEQTGDRLRVTVPMVIANASALLEAGRSRLSAGESVFDLAAVGEADSSSLTLLFAWQRAARAKGATLRIANPPASLVSLAALYGVSELLSLA